MGVDAEHRTVGARFCSIHALTSFSLIRWSFQSHIREPEVSLVEVVRRARSLEIRTRSTDLDTLPASESTTVDVALVEVGLGGRLDATNIVAPQLCVITPVDYDHEPWLVKSLEAIAGEKAGILKAGAPVVKRISVRKK